jgi:hypothetical protein
VLPNALGITIAFSMFREIVEKLPHANFVLIFFFF